VRLASDIETGARAPAVTSHQGRDEAAWRQLYESNFDYVFRTARRLGTPAEDVEDVVQEVFLVVHRKLHHFEGGRFTTWLYRICANVVMDRNRRRRVRQVFHTVVHWFAGAAPETPEQEAERHAAERGVEQVLRHIAPKKREVFALYELERLSAEEIAERIDCSVATVFSRLRGARTDFMKVAARLGLLELEGRSWTRDQ
jgi:RNA polymerase sigma-70 factor, ECF subfamily